VHKPTYAQLRMFTTLAKDVIEFQRSAACYGNVTEMLKWACCMQINTHLCLKKVSAKHSKSELSLGHQSKYMCYFLFSFIFGRFVAKLGPGSVAIVFGMVFSLYEL